ncbi:serine hydrolase domain-containing protein [Psychroserpens sp.]|uniref:serine hydrolase domain-containing protein n=1 Tax=Psychroserpens sp. TaxID=2020870 RepID=UPI00385D1A87
MKKTLLTLGIYICTLVQVFAQAEIKTPDQIIESIFNDGQTAVGLSAAYSVDGEIHWESVKGYADRKSKKPLNFDTEFRIASIAKSMTAIAVMQLVEQDKIDINLPIDTYIPEFIQKGNNKITTKHILSHTSGINGYKNNKEVESTINYKTLMEAYSVFQNRDLKFEPGTQYAYTSYGYVVLGILIEKVSGMTYESYMQKHIWNPVNMSNTGVEKLTNKRDNASKLYHKQKQGKFKDAKVNDLSNRIPGGGFYSTVRDLLKFGNAILNHTLVNEETLKLMTEHHSLAKVNNSYGFGFYLYGQQPNVGSILGHSGTQTGCSSQYFVIPSLKAVIVAISNTSGAGREVSTLAGQLIDKTKKEN